MAKTVYVRARPGRLPSPRLLLLLILGLVAGAGLFMIGNSIFSPAGLHTVSVGTNPVDVLADERGGHIFVLNSGYDTAQNPSSLTMLDARSGNVVHTTALGRASYFMVLDHVTRRLFIADGMVGVVRVIDTRSGAVVGATPAGMGTQLSVDERTGRVFGVSGSTNKVLVLDANDGHVLRTVLLPSPPEGSVADAPTGRVFVFCNKFVGRTAFPSVAILDARNGNILRVVQGLPGGLTAVNSLTGDWYLEGAAGTLKVMDGRTAATRRTIASVRPYGTIAVDAARDRLIVVEADSRNVVTIDSRTGRVLTRAALAPANGVADYVAVDNRTGRILVSGDGQTVVLDARARAVLRTTATSGVLTVDDRTGHAFVTRAHEGGQVNLGLGPVHLGYGSDAGSVTMISAR